MLRHFRNKIDLKLRNWFRWSPEVPPDSPVHEKAKRFQGEVDAFLRMFDWPRLLTAVRQKPTALTRLSMVNQKLVAVDVGARTFAMAPVIDKIFSDLGIEIELHGIEIDAYRRFTNLFTRAAYGRYYAARIRDGRYHALDFLKWQKPQDFVFMLHPFVSTEPLLRWGLPLDHFKPQELFDHSFKLLEKQMGVMIVSCPTIEEFALAEAHADKAGFVFLQKVDWQPSANHLQAKPRFAAAYWAAESAVITA